VLAVEAGVDQGIVERLVLLSRPGGEIGQYPNSFPVDEVSRQIVKADLDGLMVQASAQVSRHDDGRDAEPTGPPFIVAGRAGVRFSLTVAVRDPRDLKGPVLAFGPNDWQRFATR
jgi:hypothetical protein